MLRPILVFDLRQRTTLRKCHDAPNVIGQVMVPDLLTTFIEANKTLDDIQKSLEDYLETKRQALARIYS